MTSDQSQASTLTLSQKIKGILVLLRPKQYLKNAFVFAALIFSNSLLNAVAIKAALVAFLAMCLASSATYVFNDITDAERDRLHPKKRHRPIASGRVSKPTARVLGSILLVAALGIAFLINKTSGAVVLFYLLMQILYNWRLKQEPVADVFTIAIGFVLRAVLGAVAIRVPISTWLLFFTGSLALMLGFAKRRNEFVIQGADRSSSRQSLSHYSRESLDIFVAIFAAASFLLYAIYSIESHTAARYELLPVTVPFVSYGIARYVLLTLTQDEGGEPADLLLKDRHILVAVLGFVASAALALSGVHAHFLEK